MNDDDVYSIGSIAWNSQLLAFEVVQIYIYICIGLFPSRRGQFNRVIQLLKKKGLPYGT